MEFIDVGISGAKDSLGLGELDRWGSRDLHLEIKGRQRKYIPEDMALGKPLDGNLGVGNWPTPG